MREETIAAIATPAGEGAIAIVRISGPEAFSIARNIFSGPVNSFASHTAHYGKILSQEGETIDWVLLLVMKGPRSYTGEDSVEISCHGGSLVVKKVLDRVIEAGARVAHPGEFSLRAYLNGKLDLAQAEAVQQLIHAKSEKALAAAEKQLSGALSKKIISFRKELLEIAAIVEAWVDFPEEGLEFLSLEALLAKIEALWVQMEGLKKSFANGRKIHEGISLCLLGAPNVGKSSLMNALLRFDRAIVTPIAGTTRDLLEEDFRLGAFHFRLTDTAGLRETDEIIEKEGIRRSHLAMQQADLILLLLDATRPLSGEEKELLEQIPQDKTLLLWNKTDLSPPKEELPWGNPLSISAKESQGLTLLEGAIVEKLFGEGGIDQQEIVLTQKRHFEALCLAIDSLQVAKEHLATGTSPEWICLDLRASLKELSSILGGDVTEDLLTTIFSKFCLGK